MNVDDFGAGGGECLAGFDGLVIGKILFVVVGVEGDTDGVFSSL